MEINAKDYFQAGLERMRQARQQYSAGDSYTLAMYLCGLAVECLLRAFRWKRAASFAGRHDLLELFKASGLLGTHEAYLQERGVATEDVLERARELRAALNVIVILWANDYRYASEGRLRTRLKEMGLFKGVKGDPLKANALKLLNAAQKIVDQGVLLWTFAKK